MASISLLELQDALRLERDVRVDANLVQKVGELLQAGPMHVMARPASCADWCISWVFLIGADGVAFAPGIVRSSQHRQFQIYLTGRGPYITCTSFRVVQEADWTLGARGGRDLDEQIPADPLLVRCVKDIAATTGLRYLPAHELSAWELSDDDFPQYTGARTWPLDYSEPTAFNMLFSGG